MKVNVCKKLLFLAGGLLIGLSANAQYLRSSYFMDGTSSRLQLNPSLQPMRGYFNMPVLGSLNLGASSNVLGTSDIIDVLDSGDNLFNNDKLYDRLKADNTLNVNLNTDILSFGWYKGKGFWSVNVGLRFDVGASIPKDMFDYMRTAYNASDSETATINSFNGKFQNMNMQINSWAEVGLGYSRPINDKLTVGGRLKVLLGIARAEMQIDNYELNLDLPNGDLTNPQDIRGTANYTAAASVSTTMKGGGLSYNENNTISGFDFDGGSFGIAGAGFGIDLGASYKLLDNLTLSAAVLDLGFINWKGSETTVASVDESERVVVDETNYWDYTDYDFLSMDRFNLTKDEDATQKDIKKKLSSTVLLAGEYALFNNSLSVGAMYTARFVQPKTLNELTFSATYRPKNWFNLAVSYSPIQSAGKSLGVALKLGPLFVGTDYMFFGSNSRSVNGFLGISFPLGKKRPSTDI